MTTTLSTDTAVSASEPKRPARRKKKRSFTHWYFLAPALILYIGLGLWPILRSIQLSVTDTVGIQRDGDFIGLDNFRELPSDVAFTDAFRHTLMWIAFNLTVPTALALFLAVMLNEAVGARIFKTVFFIPLAISMPAIGIIWLWIYQSDIGLLDQVLAAVGLESWQQAWLGHEYGLASVMIAAAWRQTAFSMVIFLAGLTSIPPELVEAAHMDGANSWQTFRRIVLPMLRPATTIVISSAVTSALLATEIVLTMTKGGPFGTTDVLGHRMYTETFFNLNFGYGAAIGVVIALIATAIVIPYLSRMNTIQEGEQ